VEATNKSSHQNVLHHALSRAQAVLGELNQMIDLKLIRQGECTGRSRRRAWVRNKRNIIRLRDNLKDARESLLGVLSAEILSELPQVPFDLGRTI
jgi:hypothetical protein